MAARFEFWCREAVLAIELKGDRTEGGLKAWGRYRQPTDQIRRGLEHPVEPAVCVQRGVKGCRQRTGCLAKAILRELNRDSPPAISLSQPLPGDRWGRPEPRAVLPPRRGMAQSLPDGSGPAALGPRPAEVSQEGLDRCGGSRFQLSALQRPLGATGATVVYGLGSERTLTAIHRHGHQHFFEAGCRAEGVQSRPVEGTAEPVLIYQIAANHTSLKNSSKNQIQFVSSDFILCLRRFLIVSNSCLLSQRL